MLTMVTRGDIATGPKLSGVIIRVDDWERAECADEILPRTVILVYKNATNHRIWPIFTFFS